MLEREPNVDRPALVTFDELDVVSGGFWPFLKRRDVLGLLVDFVPADSRGWYIFIVAVVEPNRYPPRDEDQLERIEAVRAIGLWFDGACQWHVGPTDDDALQQYLDHRRSTPASESVRYLFPGRVDRFTAQRMAEGIVVEEERSGGRWELRMEN